MQPNDKSTSPRHEHAAPAEDGPSQNQGQAGSLEAFDALPNAANVRLPVVAALFSVSVATVWRWCKAGHIPKPIRIGGVALWNVGALRAFLSTFKGGEAPGDGARAPDDRPRGIRAD